MFSSFTGAITEFKVLTESGQDITVRAPSRVAAEQRHVLMHADPVVCRILPDSKIDAGA